MLATATNTAGDCCATPVIPRVNPHACWKLGEELPEMAQTFRRQPHEPFSFTPRFSHQAKKCQWASSLAGHQLSCDGPLATFLGVPGGLNPYLGQSRNDTLNTAQRLNCHQL